MKILAGPDLHVTQNKPVNRLDEDYIETIRGKLHFLFDTARAKNCEIIALPGDLFDSARANNFLKALLGGMIVEYGFQGDVFVTYGQHDMRYHSTIVENTPLRVLDATGVVEILTDKPIVSHKAVFYGASFGEDIPKIKDLKDFNILVTHRMIIEEKLWKAQEEFDRSHTLLRKTGFDLIISGDNHTSFISQDKDKTLINCGSLMRSTIAQKDHKPCVVVYDTETREHEQIFIPIEDFDEVMDTDRALLLEEKDGRIHTFISNLQDTNISGLRYKQNVSEYTTENKDHIRTGAMKLVGEFVRRHDG